MSGHRLDAAGFRALMHRLADAWQSHDTEAGVACFTGDAVYIEPPDAQLVQGHAELHAYFEDVSHSTIMRWHNLWFDEEAQTGAGEFTFGDSNEPLADHGVCVVRLRDGLIEHWREYFTRGPRDHDEFVAVEGKQWQWRPESSEG